MKNALLLLAVMVVGFACGSGVPGEKGADGPQGPMGEQGETGPAATIGGSCPAGFPLLGVSAANEPLCDHSSVTASVGDTYFSGYGVEAPNGNFLSILTQFGPNRVLYQCSNKSCSSATFEGYTSALQIAYDSGLRVTLDNPSGSLLSISRCTAADCITKTTTATQITDFLNLTHFSLSASGLPLIVYEPTSSPGIRIHACSNANCSAGTTTSVTTIRNVQPVMRLDGRLLLFYTDNAMPSSISVYDCADVQCSSGASRTLGIAGGDILRAAVGPNGIPVFTVNVISARSTSFSICSDVNCTSASSFALPAYGVSLAVRANNLASVVTLDGRLLSCSSPSCATSTFQDAISGTLFFASDGRAIISDGLTRRLFTCLKSTCEH